MTFEAMYYPFASVRSQETLKQMLLYFDKIHVLSPDQSTISKNKEELRRFDRGWLRKIQSDIHELSGEDLISTIHPRLILEKHGREFVESVKEDLKDEYFTQFKRDEGWMLYEEKMPRILKLGFRDKIYREGRFLIVKADLGESVLINHAIYSCLDYNLTPITDVEIHDQTLNHKIRRNYMKYKEFLYENGYIEELKQNILATITINEHLPGLKGVEVSDILDFRDDNKSDLKRFRIKMGEISSKIKSEPFTPDFFVEIRRIINSEINPLVIELENEINEFKDEIAVKYTKKAIPLVMSLSAITLMGLPLSIAVLGGLVVDSAGKMLNKDMFGIFESILDDWKKWRKKNRNSLNYLLKVERMG